MATRPAAATAPTTARRSCASPTTPKVTPASSPRACALAARASASRQAFASDRGRPNAARTPAGTPAATSARTTTVGGTRYVREGAAKIVSPPRRLARSATESPSGIRETAASAKSGRRKKYEKRLRQAKKSGRTARTAPSSGLVRRAEPFLVFLPPTAL